MPVMSAQFLDTSCIALVVNRELREASGYIGLTFPLASDNNGAESSNLKPMGEPDKRARLVASKMWKTPKFWCAEAST